MSVGLGALGCSGSPPSTSGDSSTGSDPDTSVGAGPGPSDSSGPLTTSGPSLDGTSSGSSSSTDSASSTGTDGSSTGSGSETTDTGESSSSGEPPMGVTVNGEVIDFVLNAPISGAEISLYDDAAVTTLANGNGMFSLAPVPANALAHFAVAPGVDYWGALIPIDVGPAPVQAGIELTQISRSIVSQQHMGLAPQMPAPLDASQGLIIVRLLQNTAVLEGDVTIDMNPPPAPDTYYSPNPDGLPVLNQNLIQWTIIPVVIYFNVADTLPGDITITATHPVRMCTVVYPQFPTLGEHMTLVDVSCPP
ncbi:MAG: hypothetical protein AAGF11_14630 [Myxococcota bacterium]